MAYFGSIFFANMGGGGGQNYFQSVRSDSFLEMGCICFPNGGIHVAIRIHHLAMKTAESACCC